MNRICCIGLSLLSVASFGLETIEYGENLFRSISQPGEVDAFQFSGSSGDMIIIRMTDAATFLEPTLELIDPNGQLIEPSTNTVRAEIIASLPSNGVYTILAADNDTDTGNYGLFLQHLFQPLNAVEICGENIFTSISTVGETDTYTFLGYVGDVIMIRMTDASTFLEPRIELFGPNGQRIESATSTVRAEIRVSLPSDGPYTILAADDDTDTGNYGIFHQHLYQPANAVEIYGENVFTNISAVGETDTYTFLGYAGDVIVIRMTDASTFLEPLIELFGPNGQRIEPATSTVRAEIRVSLPSDGPYTILAADNDTDTGNYGIFHQHLFQPANSVELEGENIFTNISTVGETDTYTFIGYVGDVIMIRMTDASTFLEPLIELFGPNGQRIEPATSTVRAEIRVTLPSDGLYTFLAADDDTDTGNYGIFSQFTSKGCHERLSSYLVFWNNQPSPPDIIDLNKNGRIDITELVLVVDCVFGSKPHNAFWIQDGESVYTNISLTGETDTYFFYGNRNDKILITMTDASTFLEPLIELFGVENFSLSGLSTTRATVMGTLPQNGLYTILASDNDTDTGNYGIFFQRVSNPGNTTFVQHGDVIVDGISHVGEIHSYTFHGYVNSEVMIRMTDTSTFLEPTVSLYDPEGEWLGTVTDTVQAEIRLLLTKEGVYTILAGDDDSDTGNYSLFLQ